MHPIEAKALGFINDDEFRSLMHGAIEHRDNDQARAAGRIVPGIPARYKGYNVIITSETSNGDVIRNLAAKEAEKQFNAHKDAKYVIVSCRFPASSDRKYEVLIQYEYVRNGKPKVIQTTGQTDKLTNASGKKLEHAKSGMIWKPAQKIGETVQNAAAIAKREVADSRRSKSYKFDVGFLNGGPEAREKVVQLFRKYPDAKQITIVWISAQKDGRHQITGTYTWKKWEDHELIDQKDVKIAPSTRN